MHVDSDSHSETSDGVREVVSRAVAAALNYVLFERTDRLLSDIDKKLENLLSNSTARLECLTVAPVQAPVQASTCIPSSNMLRFTDLELMLLDAKATRLLFRGIE